MKIQKHSEVIMKEMKLRKAIPDYSKSIDKLVFYWFRSIAFPVSAMYTFIQSSVVSLAIYDQALGELISISKLEQI